MQGFIPCADCGYSRPAHMVEKRRTLFGTKFVCDDRHGCYQRQAANETTRARRNRRRVEKARKRAKETR